MSLDEQTKLFLRAFRKTPLSPIPTFEEYSKQMRINQIILMDEMKQYQLELINELKELKSKL